MSKVKVTIRLDKNTNQQIKKLAKNNKWNCSKVIRFILNKSLGNNPNFKPALSIQRFRILRFQLTKIETNLNQLNGYFNHGFSLVNQIAKVFNILVKINPEMINDLRDYFTYSLNGIHLKQSYKLLKKMTIKVNQVWNLLNKKEV